VSNVVRVHLPQATDPLKVFDPEAPESRVRSRRPKQPDDVVNSDLDQFNTARCPRCRWPMVPQMTARGPAVPCGCADNGGGFKMNIEPDATPQQVPGPTCEPGVTCCGGAA
jgi:hypothetical protein